MAHLAFWDWSSGWGRGSRRRRPQHRPKVELLEDRCVPSTVTNLDDAGPGSLRNALNTTPDGGIVDFQPDLAGTITLTGRELMITKNLTIAGLGAGVITVSGRPFSASRVFDIIGGVTATIAGLTIENSGIGNSGTLTISDSTIRNSSFGGVGAGIGNGGVMTITGSTISGNTSITDGGGIGNSGTLTINNSTISGNVVKARSGGGIYNSASGRLTITNSTISNNGAGGSGGIVNDGTLSMRNTILAGNDGFDLSGPLTSGDHNLIGGNPELGPLQDNGGPTQTMAPLLGSPAIDAGDGTDAPPTDQRGAPRIYGGAIDIGAYEVQAAPTPVCAVAQDVLLPHHQQPVDVGLSVQLNDDADPSAHIHIQVFGNDGALPTDADLGSDALQLRAKRRKDGNGRVYLIVATVADASGQSGFDVCSAVVPYDHSRAAQAAVQAEAAAAAAYYQENQSAPPDYNLLNESPSNVGGNDAVAVDLRTPWRLPQSTPSLAETIPGPASSPGRPGLWTGATAATADFSGATSESALRSSVPVPTSLGRGMRISGWPTSC